ncbi:MAG: sigma-54-dependent Fis family transcriptional regulator [Deltaproteobacteria bacterium]|nr:sigma-54-dependent Fis family transcriptional regulator [Deltaproteobacteria bacterium]MBN2671424.1 sigma-54-dependent Fis family transcriptional regulator [Deltaproteobacteria bacterium]
MPTMKRILIVDDEVSIRVSLSALVSRSGYHVHVAGNGVDALEILKHNDIDVAFVDVRMPEMDGIEFTRLVRDKGEPLTIILMSAYGSVDDAREAMDAGAYDYITKPFKSDEVILALTKALQKEGARQDQRGNSTATGEAPGQGGIIFQSDKMARVLSLIEKIAKVESTVLVVGESGTGKELVARAIHERSPRNAFSLVPVNCGAIPENLIESELFGHKKGAFTDARADKAGLFLEADNGTLLLDEIGELPLQLQVKLLRVLQEGTFRPLGASNDVRVNVRVIAATHQNLESRVKSGQFREDLFYRLNVLPIKLPPLREREEDVLLLVEHFIQKNNRRFHSNIIGLTNEAKKRLLAHSWPGNVRELENVIERAQVLADGEYIRKEDLPANLQQKADVVRSVLDSDDLSIKKAVRIVEEELIRKALEKTGGNRTNAAKLLEISHRALLYKIKEFGIS